MFWTNRANLLIIFQQIASKSRIVFKLNVF